MLPSATCGSESEEQDLARRLRETKIWSAPDTSAYETFSSTKLMRRFFFGSRDVGLRKTCLMDVFRACFTGMKQKSLSPGFQVRWSLFPRLGRV